MINQNKRLILNGSNSVVRISTSRG